MTREQEDNQPAATSPKGRGKGGGPKTPAGKARSSKNALKHGITAPHPAIIEGRETEEEWEKFRDEIVESHAPVGRFEQELAETIASIMWRRRRIVPYETGNINYDYHSAYGDAYQSNWYLARDKDNVEEPDPNMVIILQQQRVIPRGDALDNISRYESHLNRLLFHNLHELEAFQARRRGEKTNLARISVVSPPRGTIPTRPRLDVPDFLERPLATLEKHSAANSAADKGAHGDASAAV